VLGYGVDFFGIWDRSAPDYPVQTLPRTDKGWHQAWNAFAALEPTSQSVPLGPAGPVAPRSAPPAGTNGMSVASMILGIVGIIISTAFIASILALVFGFIARGQIDRSGQGGRGMSIAGIVLGIVGIALGVVLWIILVQKGELTAP
jgi:hypothetical protein